MIAIKEILSEKSFGGYQKVFEHESDVCKCTMKFAIYLPKESENGKVPLIYWLTGATGNELTFIEKCAPQKFAAKHGLAVVCPDTSPRGCNIEGEDGNFAFGSSAGFYLNATEEKWKTNYNMYSYVTKELPDIIKSNFPVDVSKQSIMGHSMGGHGAMTIFLKNPGMFQSVSALAPVCNPMVDGVGSASLLGYLGDNQDNWKEYDSCYLVKHYNGPPLTILIDQGDADIFLDKIVPGNLVKAAQGTNISVDLRWQKGYDHYYFFVATFIEDHFDHHAKFLK